MFKTILVLVGPHADATRPAIARAAAIAERARAAIMLLGVVYDPHLEGYLGRNEIYESLRERLVAERQESLRALARDLEARGLRCETKALWAHPTDTAVVREAASPHIDLVVFEPEDTRGLSNDEWRLVSISPTPVLVVRDAAVRPYAAVVAAVDPVRSFDKPADLDDKILDLAKRMRDLSGARLEVVHSVPAFRSFIADGAAALGDTEKTLRAQRERELGEMLERAGVPPDAGAVIEGKPADVLTAKASGAEPTLLVLGAVQRGPIARFLIGSTAERVLRTDGGDVAVIQPALFGDESETATDEPAIRRVERDPSEL